MRRIILAALIAVPSVAFAADPVTVAIPVPVLSKIVNHLAAEPWKDVAEVLSEVQACIAVQIPDKDGKLAPAAQCPGVAPKAPAVPSTPTPP